jgi:hypothetical protein
MRKFTWFAAAVPVCATLLVCAPGAAEERQSPFTEIESAIARLAKLPA